MKFITIDAMAKTIVLSDFPNLVAAERSVGLDPKGLDHGTIRRGLAYVVYEFGFFEPAEEQCYFSIGNLLVAGNCVLYAYERSGETVDAEEVDFAVNFFADVAAVEQAIDDGLVCRPQISVDGDVLWQWPSPAPTDFGFPERSAGESDARQTE